LGGQAITGLKRITMKRYEWIRLVLCGFVAGVIWNLISAVFMSLVAPSFVASVQRSAPRPPLGGEFFFGVDVAMGIWAVWLYSAIAPRYGARPVTAAIVGVAWWLLKTLQSAKWAGLGFVELGADLLPLGALTLVAAMLAASVGAFLYRKATASPARRLPAT
jgi:hypothetical protein